MSQEVLFIGAGTRGAKLVGGEFQPYMDFHGKTCLEYVVEAAMGAKSVRDIYIWGDKKTLDRILAGHVSRYEHPLVIVAERGNIMESFFFTYLDYLARHNYTLRSMIAGWDSIKAVDWIRLREHFIHNDAWEQQVNVIVSDTPLISSFELDFLIENKKTNVDLIIGRTMRRDYKAVLEKLGEFPDKKKSVKNFYTYRFGTRDVSLIVNSFIAGKPLKLNENIWNLAGSFYEHRTIIAGRRKNFRNIIRNLLYFKRVFFPSQSGGDTQGYTARARAVFYLANAYKAIVKSKSSSVYYRDLFRIYDCVRTLVDLDIKFDLSHCFGSAFDIDTPYEADFIRRHFFALQDILADYYKTRKVPPIIE
jgi:hypothetical protein